jgi:2-polyprenyl-6-methoxyphenol hydroxylase-like FAD-dependent oxidoreductase
MNSETEVLIVGSGPTGLMLALCLARQGIGCRLIDKSATRSDKSRALVLQARSLELLQRLGVADELVALGRRTVQARGYVNGRRAFDFDLVDIGADDTPYPFVLFVSQAETEAVLEKHVRLLGVADERGVELLSFAQDASGVDARVRHADSHEEAIRSRYIVGCDGAHSVVRKGAGLTFEGAPYEQSFLLADVKIDGPEAGDRFSFIFAKDGVLVMLPLAEPQCFRLILSGRDLLPPGTEEPTLDQMQALMTRLCPFPARLHDPHWLTRFRLHHRGVDHYRAGRAFVAGDAAHIHSPAGGQGMNTGLQDSMNLAWKLALVLRSLASEALLDSYEAERLPVGRHLLRFTDRLFSLGASTNPLLLRVRNLLVPFAASFVIRRKERRARAFRFVSQLGIRYARSPIVGGETRGFAGGPPPGSRAPDAPLLAAGQRTTLFRQLSATKHDLLVFGEAMPDELRQWAAANAAWVELHQIAASDDDAGLARRRYGVTGPAVYLIRPDGYVAFRAAGDSLAPIAAFQTKSRSE